MQKLTMSMCANRDYLEGYNQAVDDAAKDTRVAELEAALRDALGSFKCTQHVLSYPESHWSRRACALLNEEPEQPSYLTFVRP